MKYEHLMYAGVANTAELGRTNDNVSRARAVVALGDLVRECTDHLLGAVASVNDLLEDGADEQALFTGVDYAVEAVAILLAAGYRLAAELGLPNLDERVARHLLERGGVCSVGNTLT